MALIYLLLGILSSALVSICMRISEKKIRSNVGMLTVNYLTCTVFAALYTGGWTLDTPLYATCGLGILNGVLYLASFLLLQRNIRRSGVVLLSASISYFTCLTKPAVLLMIFLSGIGAFPVCFYNHRFVILSGAKRSRTFLPRSQTRKARLILVSLGFRLRSG